MAGHTHISYDTCAACAEAHKDQLPGGLGDDKTPEDFDPKAVEKGRKVELEHTDDPDLATEITLDHLSEDPLYYDKLETIESCFKVVTAKYAVSALSIEVVVGPWKGEKSPSSTKTTSILLSEKLVAGFGRTSKATV
jgi:hypothetical protein